MNANGTGARWQGRFAVVRIIVFGMYSCAVVALAAYGLVHGARMDEWRRLWATLYAAVFTLFLPAFVWLRFGYLGINARKSARWRAAQLPADAELLPVAADQPAPLTPEELATLPRGFTAVRTVDTSTEQVWRGAWGTFQTVLICGLMLSLTYV